MQATFRVKRWAWFKCERTTEVDMETDMKNQTLLFVFTVVNTVAMMVILLLQPHDTSAQETAPVLRAHALQIVDDNGRIRAEIRVFPPDPKVKMPDGTTGYPETVLLRMITSKGAPNVKIAATEDGSAVSFGGEANPTHVQVLARGTNTSLKLVNKDGRQQVITPQ